MAKGESLGVPGFNDDTWKASPSAFYGVVYVSVRRISRRNLLQGEHHFAVRKEDRVRLPREWSE